MKIKIVDLFSILSELLLSEKPQTQTLFQTKLHHVSCPFSDLAPVVQKVDSAVHRINHYPVDNTILLILIRWIVIYPVDSATHVLSNRIQPSRIHSHFQTLYLKH